MIKGSVANQLSRIAKFCGVDRAILYTIFGKGIQILTGPITLILISQNLHPAEQGFYYTFSSIVNLQIFFELGLSFVILQFASHEKAELMWNDSNRLVGDKKAKERIASLFRLATKCYGIIALIMISVLIPLGISFLGTNKSAINVPWVAPWVLVVVSTGSLLFLSPFLSFLEGCGLVTEVAYMRVLQVFLSSLSLWIALSFKTNLYAAAVPNLVGSLWISSWLYIKYKYFFIDLLNCSKYINGTKNEVRRISWLREIFPLQWRIALSALSGYLIFSLFTPVLFKFHGPIVAGKMGMSLSITSAISALAMSWVSTKLSPFGSLIAARNYAELDRQFFPALWKSVGVAVLGGLIFWILVLYLYRIDHPFCARLVELLPLMLLLVSNVCNTYVFGLAIYLRAHKREPFLGLSVTSGILTALSTYFLGRDYGIIGMSSGYCVINVLFSVIFATYIFINKRKEWHRTIAVN